MSSWYFRKKAAVEASRKQRKAIQSRYPMPKRQAFAKGKNWGKKKGRKYRRLQRNWPWVCLVYYQDRGFGC